MLIILEKYIFDMQNEMITRAVKLANKLNDFKDIKIFFKQNPHQSWLNFFVVTALRECVKSSFTPPIPVGKQSVACGMIL